MYVSKLSQNTKPFSTPTIKTLWLKYRSEVTRMVNELSVKEIASAPVTVSELDELSARTKEGLSRFLDTNLTSKIKKARDLTCFFELGLNEGTQQLSHIWQRAAKNTMKEIEFAKSMPEYAYLTFCTATETLFMLKKPELFNFKMTKRGFECSEDSYLFDADGECPEDTSHLKLLSDMECNTLVSSYHLVDVAVQSGEIQCGGGLGLGNEHQDLEYLSSQFGLSEASFSGQGFEPFNYYSANGGSDLIVMLVNRPSDSTLEEMISELSQV